MDMERIWAGDTQSLLLMLGELSPQELRTIKALLNALRPEREALQQQIRLLQEAKDLLKGEGWDG